MQKFYSSVEIKQADSGHHVLLDGKPVKTPARQVLRIPSQALAERVAEEWRVQGERIDPDTMPVTRIVAIALDRVPHDRAALIDDMTRYGETDLLCYRAPSPLRGEGYAPQGDNLRALQELHFTPILAWAAGQGIVLEITETLTPIPQPASSLARLREMVAAADDMALAALALITPLLGSAVLALALWKGQIDVEEAIRCARLDETHQSARWGEDDEAAAQWMKRERDIRAGVEVFASNRK